MNKTLITLLGLSAVLIAAAPAIAQTQTRRMRQSVLKDKIKGGWAGQMIGTRAQRASG